MVYIGISSVEQAEDAANKQRGDLLVAAVQRLDVELHNIQFPLRDRLDAPYAMLYVGTWFLQKDVQTLDGDVKLVHKAADDIKQTSRTLVGLTRALILLTTVLTISTVILVLRVV